MIKTSTGKGKINKPVDVLVLQLLLNDIDIAKAPVEDKNQGSKDIYVLAKDLKGKAQEKLPKLLVDGTSVSKLINRIEIYQKVKKMKVIDGWVGPRGKTIRSLMTDATVSAGTTRMKYIRNKLTGPFGLSHIKVDKVINLYDRQYGALNSNNRSGFRYILKTAKVDSDLSFLPEFAYMLATAKHETAHTFRAIEEYGKGNGRSYGKEVIVTNPATKTINKNKYYGRGYVQLTWGYNYQRIDQQLGNGVFPNRNKTKASEYNKGFTISSQTKSIYLNPAKALDQENAYVGLVWGMQKGIYTSKRIGDYVNKTKIDYYNARRVINGTDKAITIAGYAEDLEILLLISTR